MTRRLLVSYLTVTLIVLLLLEVPLALFYAQREIERLTADVASDASVIATVYEDDLERGLPLDPRPAEEYEARTGARVVVVDSDGIARVDTQQPTPRDFSTRPEIVVALGGNRTSGTRSSDTLDTDLLYVALPVASGGVVHGALRVTLETSHVDSHVRRFWAGLVGIGAVVLGVMALIGWAVARSVSRPVRALNATATRFARGDLSVPDDHEASDGPPELPTNSAPRSPPSGCAWRTSRVAPTSPPAPSSMPRSTRSAGWAHWSPISCSWRGPTGAAPPSPRMPPVSRPTGSTRGRRWRSPDR